MVDAAHSKCAGVNRGGSSPSSPTILKEYIMNFMYGKEIGELLLLDQINNTYVDFAGLVNLAFENNLEHVATESLLNIPAKN